MKLLYTKDEKISLYIFKRTHDLVYLSSLDSGELHSYVNPDRLHWRDLTLGVKSPIYADRHLVCQH